MTKLELRELLVDQGVVNKDFIEVEDIADDIKDKVEIQDGYNYIYKDEFTFEEKMLALQAKQAKHLDSIRKMFVFFVVLTIITMVIYFFIGFNAAV